jgi:hypothetical protein
MKKMSGLYQVSSVAMLMLILSFGQNSQAIQDCLFVEVGGVSFRLESLTIPKMSIPGGAKKPVRIEVSAKKDDGRDIVTPFDCERNAEEITCVQPDGAGDFFLREHNGVVTFESEYLNFALGATSGLPPRQPDDEINEDYAIVLEDEDDQEATHPMRVKLKVESVKCTAPNLGK